MWSSFLARSTLKVRDDLARKTKLSNSMKSYMGVWDPSKLNRYDLFYFVIEWVATDQEIVQVNNEAKKKPIIMASWLAKLLMRCYNCPVVHHEVPFRFQVAPYSPNKYEKFYGFTVFYQLTRKNPDIVKAVLERLKYPILVLTSSCDWFTKKMEMLGHVCMPKFGLFSESELKSAMADKWYIWLTGVEGFGLPPLEASSIGSFPIAFPYMPLTEWYPKEFWKYLIPPKITRIEGIYQGNVLHPVARPTSIDELADFLNEILPNEPTREERKALIDYVVDNYTNGKQYMKIDEFAQQYYPNIIAR